MHKRLIEEGFNRRYVLLPLLLSIAFVVAGYVLTEVRRSHTRELTQSLRTRADLIRLVVETSGKAMQAESAQRGYLLTGEEKYLPPLETGLAEAAALLADLRERYHRLDPEQVKVVDAVSEDLKVKAQEMRESTALYKAGKAQEALALVKTDLGLYQTHAITYAMEGLRMHERQQIAAGVNEWEKTVQANVIINTCNAVFTIAILLVLGLLATRDIRRRNGFAADLAVQIDARTTELRDLSRHMSRVAETEKHALARELHDELGGLLVAMRMDISQIRKRLGASEDADLKARWARVEQAVAQGLELKRRVIEDLRPTLLDNMGLFTALRWLGTQTSEQAQLTLHMNGLDVDIDIPPEAGIAVFRTAQEAMSNIVKHANGTRLTIEAGVDRTEDGTRLTIEIADDGRGMPEDAGRRVGSHGLKAMRFRMESVDGTLEIAPGTPRGTSIVLSVPLPPAEGAAV